MDCDDSAGERAIICRFWRGFNSDTEKPFRRRRSNLALHALPRVVCAPYRAGRTSMAEVVLCPLGG